jgi:hypothetical protein
MIDTELIKKDPQWGSFWNLIKDEFTDWDRFLHERITFQYTGSRMHAYGHEERVLLYALLAGAKEGLEPSERRSLAIAAVFHDTRRKDDSIEPGHGHRAAAHYYYDHVSLGLADFDIAAYQAMGWHAESDYLGEDDILAHGLDRRLLLIYHLFKDADALDRTRFGRHSRASLSPERLRLESSRQLVDLAYSLAAGSRSL